MKDLKISSEVSFPIDVVTQTLAAIGRKGSGKTYLATMIAEQMLDAKAQVVVMDPVGNWWGLRVAEDGKHVGKEIFVIGGEHGDVPLIPEAGKQIAHLIVDKGISAVIDVSGFRVGELKRFAADFAEEYFQLKKTKRTPGHMFIEEAQIFIPQRVGPDEARMVGAFERIVRLGRNYGIGCTLITQRPQSVNKEVLSQVECLCVLQVTGLHERKALEGWVQEAGADRKLIGELPSLERGEGYVWSPSWLKVYKRVHFAKKKTFDASATPEVGKATQAASLSAVDVEELKKNMQEVIAKAEEEDPKALHRKIKILTEQMKSAGNQSTTNLIQKEEVRVEVAVLKDSQIKRLEVITEKIAKELASHSDRMHILATNFQVISASIEAAISTVKGYERVKHVAVNGNAISQPVKNISEKKVQPTAVEGTKPLSKGASSVLSYLRNAYPHWKSKTQMWVATGYSPGSTFNNLVYELTGANLIEKDGTGAYAALHGDSTYFDSSLTKWDSKLSVGAGKIFHFLMGRSDMQTKENLAEATGYALGSTFNNLIYELTGKELVIKVGTAYKINPEILDL